jgi:AcrR family transcriptional regulator
MAVPLTSSGRNGGRVGRPVFDASVAPTRQRILNAALDLFFKQGFAATSVKEITLAAGITQGAMYKHFASKEELLHTLIVEATAEGSRLIDEHLAAVDDDPVTQLYAVAYASTLYYTRHRAASMVATFEYIHLDDDLRQDIIKYRLSMRRRVEHFIAAGVAAERFRLPDGGKHAVKFAATALVNVSMRATEMFGPFPQLGDEDLSHFHAVLAIRMLGAEPPAVNLRYQHPMGSAEE